MKKGNKKGFTLIELIVVLAILAIIAAIAVPSAFSSIDEARKQADAATISSVNSAIRTHSGLTLKDGKVDPALTVEDCLKGTGTSITIKIQSPNTKVKWVDGTNSAPGHYEIDATNGTHVETLVVSYKVTGTTTTP